MLAASKWAQACQDKLTSPNKWKPSKQKRTRLQAKEHSLQAKEYSLQARRRVIASKPRGKKVICDRVDDLNQPPYSKLSTLDACRRTMTGLHKLQWVDDQKVTCTCQCWLSFGMCWHILCAKHTASWCDFTLQKYDIPTDTKAGRKRKQRALALEKDGEAEEAQPSTCLLANIWKRSNL